MREWVEAALKENTINSADIAFADLTLTLAASKSDALWCASVLASAAVQNGDVCVTLTYVADKVAGGVDSTASENSTATINAKSIRDELLTSGVVQTAEVPVTLPLVLDGADRLYLARYWQLERELAEMLLSLLNATSGEPPVTPSMALLNDLFPPLLPLLPPPPPDWQRVASVVAARQRLCVITGGPGTGKTRTVARLLAVLQAQACQPLRIALLAPTGKAAARLLESLRGEVSQLQQQGLSLEMPDVASTLHRALGYQPGRRGFKHNAGFPLPFDLVLVDEASMVDLSLMYALLSALDEHTRLVLLGDRDQLASVEAGNVLGDIVGTASPEHYSVEQRDVLIECCEGFDAVGPVEPAGGMADAIVELRHSYRFDAKSGIGRFASAVNGGDATTAIEIGEDGNYSDLSFISPENTVLNEQLAQQAVPVALNVINSETVADALAASLSYRVLCALYHGPRGVEAINRFIESRLVRQGHMQPNQLWYKGRPILITRNDPGTALYNGDTGLIWPDANGHMMAWFADADANNNNGVRPVAPGRLPAHQTCYAMTVHKTQGSEFSHVLLVLPEPPHTLLTRDLLYTGITRARTEAEIYGSEDAIRVGCEAKRERASGLRDRLWG
jgi:exodeoxyribonuclease V alpha subunit